MPKIRVIEFLGIEFAIGDGLKEFTPGVHEVTEDQLGHPQIQAAIEAGQAEVIQEPEAAGTGVQGSEDSVPAQPAADTSATATPATDAAPADASAQAEAKD